MTILWCGGEDVDFNGYAQNNIGSYDSSFSRACIGSATWVSTSTFPEVTSFWLTARYGTTNTGAGNLNVIGIGNKSSSNAIFLQIDKNGGAAHIVKYVSGSPSTIGSVTGLYIGSSSTYKIDLQITEYGSNATVKLYLDGNLIIDTTGDVSLETDTLNCLFINNDPNWYNGVSEIILADEDTRLFRLKTIYPNASGDTSANWTGAYTDIDETSLSDADKIYSNTADADFQCNLTGMPSGSWSVKAVKVAARCVDGSGSKGIALGVKSGGTVNVGDAQTCSGYWQTKERMMTVNPVTGNPWTPAEIEALQFNLRCKAV